MRFGIMSMQIHELVPRNKPALAILADLKRFSLAKLAKKLFQQGFNPIELGGDLGMFIPRAYSPESIAELDELKQKLGVEYTLHLPLWSVEPSTLLRPVRQGSQQALIEILRAVKGLEPEMVVLHATGALAAEFYQMRISELAKGLILKEFQKGARESIRVLTEETGWPSRRLAVETIEFPLELTLDIVEEMDTSICLDTGHVLAGFSGPMELFDCLERCLPRLGEVHLHDSPWQGPQQKIEYGKDHQPLGTADLDVGRLLDRLHQADYQGPIIFELTLEEALQSMKYIHQIRPQYIEKPSKE